MTRAIKQIIFAQALRTLNFAGPILILFLVAKGLSLQQIMTLIAFQMLAGAAFEIPTGVFGDRVGRKWSMAAGTAVSIIAWFLWISVDTFSGFIVAQLFFALAGALWSGSDQAFIIDELKRVGAEARTQKVIAAYGACVTAAYGVAALIGGAIVRVHRLENYYILFGLTIIAACSSLVVSLFLKETRHTHTGDVIEQKPEKALSMFGSGIKVLIANKKLRKVVLYFVFTTMPGFVLMDFYQVYFVHARVPDSWFGPALAISAFIVAAMKWYSYKIEEWLGVERGLFVTALIPIILFVLIGSVFNPVAAVALFWLTDAANNVRDPLIADYQNRHIHGANRATVLSTISLLASIFIAITQPIIGAIADYNLSAAFFATAGLIAFGAIFFRINKEDVEV